MSPWQYDEEQLEEWETEMPSKIEWTDETWNPVTGCTKVSAGCKHCYAERMAKRLEGRFGYPKKNPFEVTLHPDRLDEPLRWRKPRRVFVASMSDLFHAEIPDDFLDRVFDVMDPPDGDPPSPHVFMLLTKRPDRMRDYAWSTWAKCPPKNVWLGVSVEDQASADERIPMLLETPAAARFVSCEPLLGPVDLRNLPSGTVYNTRCMDALTAGSGSSTPWHLDWIIAGGESGPGARPAHPDWFRSVRDQCAAAGVAFFMKQMGKKVPIPEDLMIREYPLAFIGRP